MYIRRRRQLFRHRSPVIGTELVGIGNSYIASSLAKASSAPFFAHSLPLTYGYPTRPVLRQRSVPGVACISWSTFQLTSGHKPYCYARKKTKAEKNAEQYTFNLYSYKILTGWFWWLKLNFTRVANMKHGNT